mmetsp:Transcript_134612/g.429910  ORF Transcript_134612/g.429910 Transcript_134612/m.429910 type:complete len:216 (-) Transcript_134612:1490-2137(-)
MESKCHMLELDALAVESEDVPDVEHVQALEIVVVPPTGPAHLPDEYVLQRFETKCHEEKRDARLVEKHRFGAPECKQTRHGDTEHWHEARIPTREPNLVVKLRKGIRCQKPSSPHWAKRSTQQCRDSPSHDDIDDEALEQRDDPCVVGRGCLSCEQADQHSSFFVSMCELDADIQHTALIPIHRRPGRPRVPWPADQLPVYEAVAFHQGVLAQRG